MKLIQNHSQAAVLLVGLGLAIATLVAPVPAHEPVPPAAFHAQLLIETFLATISSGAAVLFLQGLSGYKTDLKIAYRFIAVGMYVYALALVQLPILQSLNLFNSWYVTNGWLNLLYVASSLLLLFGVLRYARLVQAHSKMLSTGWVIVLMAVAAIGAPLLPHHQPAGQTDFSVTINTLLTAITAMLLTITAAGVLAIKRAAGPAYTNALAWLFLGVLLLALSTFSTVYFQLNGFVSPYVNSGLFFVPFLVGVICSLRSSVAFNKITQY